MYILINKHLSTLSSKTMSDAFSPADIFAKLAEKMAEPTPFQQAMLIAVMRFLPTTPDEIFGGVKETIPVWDLYGWNPETGLPKSSWGCPPCNAVRVGGAVVKLPEEYEGWEWSDISEFVKDFLQKQMEKNAETLPLNIEVDVEVNDSEKDNFSVEHEAGSITVTITSSE